MNGEREPETIVAVPSPVAELEWHRMPDAEPIATTPGWYTAGATLIGRAGCRIVSADGSVLGAATRVAGAADERAEFAFRSPGGDVFAEYGGDEAVCAQWLCSGPPFTPYSGGAS